MFLLRLSCKRLTATFHFSDDLLRKVTAINDEFDAQVNSLKSTITDAESAANADKAEMQAHIVHITISLLLFFNLAWQKEKREETGEETGGSEIGGAPEREGKQDLKTCIC